MASNDPTPQLYARVPVRWEVSERGDDEFFIKELLVGAVTDNGDGTFTPYIRTEAPAYRSQFFSYHPRTSLEAARKAVEEYWAVATEDGK